MGSITDIYLNGPGTKGWRPAEAERWPSGRFFGRGIEHNNVGEFNPRKQRNADGKGDPQLVLMGQAAEQPIDPARNPAAGHEAEIYERFHVASPSEVVVRTRVA